MKVVHNAKVVIQLTLDVAIIGTGPAGLSFARTLGVRGVHCTVVENQPLEAIQDLHGKSVEERWTIRTR